MPRMSWCAPCCASRARFVGAQWCSCSRGAADLRQARVHGRDEPIGCQPELLEEDRARRTRAVVVEADHLTVVTDEIAPAHGDRRLDGSTDEDVGWQNQLPV